MRSATVHRLTCGVAAVVVTLALNGTAHAATGNADGWTTFYEEGPLAGSGWAACPEPIRVSLDTPLYQGKAVGRIVTALSNTVSLWSRAAGISFVYDGMIPVVYSERTGVTAPADGIDRPRHIYFAVIADKDSGLLDNEVVGLGAPTGVLESGEITEADVTFEYEYVKKVSTEELTALFTHEFGHALGLGHSANKQDVMYPYVSKAKKLGPGDLAGIQAITRPCSAAEPSRDYPLPS